MKITAGTVAMVFAALVSTGASAKVILDASGCTEGEAMILEKGFIPVFEKNMPFVVELLEGKEAAEKPIEDVKLILVNDFNRKLVVASCVAERREIRLGVKWAQTQSFEEVSGALVHEFAHAVQFYWRPGRKAPPIWVTEGIADWVRWYNYEPLERRKFQPELGYSRRYNAKYRVTATFLDWVCRTYDPQFVIKLHRICRDGGYDDVKTWIDLTGKTQEELGAEWRATIPPAEGSFELASYNIRRAGKPDVNERDWTNRLALVVDVVNRHGFEVMGLQEAYPSQIRDLREALPGWDSFGRGRSKSLKDEASPIFWKTDRFEKLDGGQFWMSETPDEPGSKSWKAMFPRICTWVKLRDLKTSKEFFYFNCHTDHASIEARRKGVRVILDRIASIAKDAPVVLSGDFNDEVVDDRLREEVRRKDHTKLSPEGPDHPINIVKSVLKDSLDVSKTEHVGTIWTDNGYGEKHIKRIDYVFVSDAVEVLAHETCRDRPNGVYPSDHEALSTTLRLK